MFIKETWSDCLDAFLVHVELKITFNNMEALNIWMLIGRYITRSPAKDILNHACAPN